jgi:DNA polymerase
MVFMSTTKSWQDILEIAGFPTEVIVLDFETYFDQDYSLRKMSTVEFVMDSRFEVTGLGMWFSSFWKPHCGRDFKEPNRVVDSLEQLQLTHGSDLSGITIVGQNLKFDALILRERYGITPKYTVDILDLSRHLDARDKHDLGHLANKYRATKPKGDTMQFCGLHRADMTEAQRAALQEYCLNDIDIEVYLFKILLPRMTWPQVELRLANQTLHQFLVPQIKIDSSLGEQLIVDMTAELQKPVDETNALGVRVIEPGKMTKRTSKPPRVRAVTVADVSKDSTFLSLLASALPEGEGVPMKQGKKKMIPALAKTDTQLDYLLSHPNPRVRALMVARKATDSWPAHISRVRKLMAQAAARGGMLGIPLTYYAAHTGRYGGTHGINPQNFGARDVHDLVKQVGQMLVAPSGYIFGTGDLSQIEARVVAWFAGQEDLLEAFAQGRDIYSEFAQEQIYHKETRKPHKDDSPELVKALTTRRNVGKETILGAGFGMGGNTFYERCKQKPSLKEAIAAGELTFELCQRAINVYRKRFSLIKAFWGEVEKAWRFVARYRDQRATVSHYGRTLQFWNENGTVVIQLPSSRCLFYPHAAVSAVDSTCRYQWGHVYGGSITENVVQATARDIFALGLLRMEDAGMNTLMTIHDQAVCLFAEESAEDCLQKMHAFQCVLPAWANDLPVATEGGLCERYHKT